MDKLSGSSDQSARIRQHLRTALQRLNAPQRGNREADPARNGLAQERVQTDREEHGSWGICGLHPPPTPACDVGFACPDHLDGHFDCKPVRQIDIFHLDPLVIKEGLVSINEVEVAPHQVFSDEEPGGWVE